MRLNVDAKRVLSDQLDLMAGRLAQTERDIRITTENLLGCEIMRLVAPEDEILDNTADRRVALMSGLSELLRQRATIQTAQAALKTLASKWDEDDTQRQIETVVAWVEDHARLK